MTHESVFSQLASGLAGAAHYPANTVLGQGILAAGHAVQSARERRADVQLRGYGTRGAGVSPVPSRGYGSTRAEGLVEAVAERLDSMTGFRHEVTQCSGSEVSGTITTWAGSQTFTDLRVSAVLESEVSMVRLEARQFSFRGRLS